MTGALSSDPWSVVVPLAVALSIGLLVGTERGWHERDADDGQRLAGVRTFALIGLFGGICAALPDSPLLLPAGLLALSALLGFARQGTRRRDHGATTLIAAAVTYGLGAMAVAGAPGLAAGAAVLATTLLGLKQPLHALLRQLRADELLAVLQMLLLAVVVMPLLPHRAIDPWELISPYEFAGLILLLALLSFAGYAAVRTLGPQLGALLGGAAGGLVSSTAVIVAWAPTLRKNLGGWQSAATAMVAACGVMPLRVLAVCGVLSPPLAKHLILLSTAMAFTLLPFLLLHRQATGTSPANSPALRNPMSLWSAARFAALLVLVMFAVSQAQEHFGTHGLLYASAIGGAADVDAIVLSLAHLTGGGVDPRSAAAGVMMAMLANNAVKLGLAVILGGRAAWRSVALPLAAASIAGLVAFLA